MNVSSRVKINRQKIKQLTMAQITALEKTTEALHTEVVQAQVFPFQTGNTQNESTFPDYSKSKEGRTSIVTSNPYARRLYYHPEYHFSKAENPNARGNWYQPWIDGKEKNFCKETFKKFYKEDGGL